MFMDLGGTVGGAQQQQGSASRASVVGRCFIPMPSLNNGNFSNLFNSWISYSTSLILKAGKVRALKEAAIAASKRASFSRWITSVVGGNEVTLGERVPGVPLIIPSVGAETPRVRRAIGAVSIGS